MGLSGFIAHARSIKRMMLGTNIFETKKSYINNVVFSELDLVCLTMTYDE